MHELLATAIGPVPWYWQTFPSFTSQAGQRFVWTHHGMEGPTGYLVTLNLEQEPDKPRLALNTYCVPFLVPPDRLGIWCPEGRNLRLTCFDPEQLKAFDLSEVAGWFKQSAERIYAHSEPIADFEVVPTLQAGLQKIDVPPELATVEELIIPTSYKSMNKDDPAFALYVFYLHAGLVEVLPQKWFTPEKFDIGYQWITRAVRDPESHRIVGDGFRIDAFLLEEDGCSLARWIEKRTEP